MLYVSYNDALREQQTSLRNLSIAFAAQTLTRGAGGRPGDAPGRARLPQRRRRARRPLSSYFDENGPAQEYLLGIHVYDSDGQLVASGAPASAPAPRAPASAPASARTADSPTCGCSITISNIDPDTGRGVINFTRAIIDAARRAHRHHPGAGRFGAFRTHLHAWSNWARAARSRCSTATAPCWCAAPTFPSGIGHSFSAHAAVRAPAAGRPNAAASNAVSPIDGVVRLYGYDAVPGFPLVIITGMNQTDALAAWYGRLWTALGFFSLVSLTLVFLAWRVARDAARQVSADRPAGGQRGARRSQRRLPGHHPECGRHPDLGARQRAQVRHDERGVQPLRRARRRQSWPGRPNSEVLDPASARRARAALPPGAATAPAPARRSTELRDGARRDAAPSSS